MSNSKPRRPRPRISVTKLIEHASTACDMPVQDFSDPSRYRIHQRPRYAVCLAAHRLKHFHSHTGRVLKRHHSTIINAIRRAEEMAAEEERFARFVNDLAKGRKLEPNSYVDVRDPPVRQVNGVR